MSSPSTEKKLSEFAAEERRRRIINYSAYCLVALLVLFLLLLIFGNTFNGILARFGFDMTEKGVYADCSDRSNRDNPYCQPKKGQADKDWDDLRRNHGKSIPFSLTDR